MIPPFRTFRNLNVPDPLYGYLMPFGDDAPKRSILLLARLTTEHVFNS
jgi:hypothetical protein